MTFLQQKSCILRAPKLFHAVRLNPKLTDIGRATEELQKHLGPELSIFEESTLSNVLITEGNGPNLSLKPEEKEVYLDLHGTNRVLRGEAVQSFCVAGASTSDFEVGERVSIFADIRNGCRQGGTLNLQKLEKKVFLGNARMLLGRKEIWPIELNFKHGECRRAFILTDPVWTIPSFENNCMGNWGSTGSILETLLVALLDPKPGQAVLDMNASSSAAVQYMDSLMQNSGKVCALVKGTRDAGVMMRRNKELGCSAVQVIPSSPDILRGLCFPKNSFDKIFLMAPSSELGVRGKFMRKCLSPDQLLSVQKSQRRLIRTVRNYTVRTVQRLTKSYLFYGLELLKSNGQLVYFVNSLKPEEGVEVVDWALKQIPSVHISTLDSFRNHEAAQMFYNHSFGEDAARVFDPRIFCGVHGDQRKPCVLRPITRRTNHPWKEDFALKKLNCFQDCDGTFVAFLSKHT